MRRPQEGEGAAADLTRISVLGPLAVSRAGAALELPPSKKCRGLLAYLALDGRSHLRSRLSDLLWDVADDPRGGLRWCLSKLRAVVDSDDARVIVADRRSVSLDRAACWIDIVDARAKVAAGVANLDTPALAELAGYFRGELLDGLEFFDLHAMQAWLVAARSEARKLDAAVLAELVGRLGGEPERAIPYARRLVELAPQSDEHHARLHRLLVAAGLHQEAADQLENGFRVLGELGASTHALHVARRALRRPSIATSTGATSTGATPVRPTGDIAFVGRDAELAVLVGALDAAVAGSGRSCVLVGEAGIGKSRLASELAAIARGRGVRVVQGSCVSTAGAPPFLPFIEALDDVVVEVAGRDRERALLSHILPSLAGSTSAAEASEVSEVSEVSDADRFAVFRAAASVMGTLAEPNGLLVLLEDLHWADAQSLLMLGHVVRQLGASRVLVVATCREAVDSDLVGETLAALRRIPGHTTIELGRLGADAARALIADLIGDDSPDGDSDASAAARSAAIAERTEGHPLFIVELVKHLVEEGRVGDGDGDLGGLEDTGLPARIRDVISHRVARLGDGCRRLLTIASAMSGAIRWPVLVEVIDGDEDELLDQLDEALAAKIIRERQGTRSGVYDFAHALIGRLLYDQLSAPRRMRLHARIAAALERTYRQHLEPHLADLAYHHGEATDGIDLTAFVDYTLRAGAYAFHLMAFEDAAALYRRALERLAGRDDEESRKERAELHLRRGVALASLSQWTSARADFERGLELAPADLHELRARLLVNLAQSQLWTLDTPGLVSSLDRALEHAGAAGSKELEVAATAFSSMRSISMGDLEGALAIVDGARSAAPAMDDPLVVESLTTAYPQILYWMGRYEPLLEYAGELRKTVRSSTLQMLVFPLIGLSLGARGSYRRANEVFAESVQFGRDHNIRNLLARSSCMATGNMIDTYDLDGAQTNADACVQLAREVGFPPTVISAQIDLCRIAMMRGNAGVAESYMPALRQGVAKMAGWHQWIFALRTMMVDAELALLRGKLDAALESVEAVIAKARSVPRRKHVAGAVALRGEIHLASGETGAGLEDLRSALSLARDMRYPAMQIRIGSRLLSEDGDDELLRELAASVSLIESELDGAAREAFLAARDVSAVVAATS